MEDSILKSTKKILNIPEDYNAFDLEVLTMINSAFSDLNDLGVGPKAGFVVNDDTSVWSDFTEDVVQQNSIRTYVYLKARLLFDPPATSFHIKAMEDQIKELGWRINVRRESNVVTAPQ